MHDSTLDLFAKVGIDANDIEALAAYYEVTCDYYMEEFLGLEDLIDCLLYTSPSPLDHQPSRMPSSA